LEGGVGVLVSVFEVFKFSSWYGRWGTWLGNPEVIHEPREFLMVSDECTNVHSATTAWAAEWIELEDLFDHPGPGSVRRFLVR
jgi:hypothetical protein